MSPGNPQPVTTPLEMILQPGEVVLTNCKKCFLSRAIRFFSRSHYSHSALAIGDVQGFPSVLEADMVVTTMPFHRYVDSPIQEYEIWRPVGRTITEPQPIIKMTFDRYVSKGYGYLQLLWFMWRWFWELFGIDMRSKKNWFPNGDICSELVCISDAG